jgi:hypothetical protein
MILNFKKSSLSDLTILKNKIASTFEKTNYSIGSWKNFDFQALENDINKGVNYQIITKDEPVATFSIFRHDPIVWKELDGENAAYLHRVISFNSSPRIFVFPEIINWIRSFEQDSRPNFIRIDTWFDNDQLIRYYKSLGFQFVRNQFLGNIPDLAPHNRNIKVALFQLTV